MLPHSVQTQVSSSLLDCGGFLVHVVPGISQACVREAAEMHMLCGEKESGKEREKGGRRGREREKAVFVIVVKDLVFDGGKSHGCESSERNHIEM